MKFDPHVDPYFESLSDAQLKDLIMTTIPSHFITIKCLKDKLETDHNCIASTSEIQSACIALWIKDQVIRGPNIEIHNNTIEEVYKRASK